MKKSRAPVVPRLHQANHFASNVIAISVAPRWVELILKGHKTVELRRRGPGRDTVGARMLIYATRPWSALVATCIISKIRISTPKELWTEVGSACGCSHQEFFDYFADLSQATAVEIRGIRELKAIGLDTLARQYDWRPPVSWCRVPTTSKLLATFG
jgi:predicted transcriptional regulator